MGSNSQAPSTLRKRRNIIDPHNTESGRGRRPLANCVLSVLAPLSVLRGLIMNSKQRVHAALRREPVDRLPIFMWFHPQTTAILAKTLEIPPRQVDFVMGNDVRMTWVNNNYAMEGIVHEHDGEGHVDVWGIHWVKAGPYNQITGFPPGRLPRPTRCCAITSPSKHRRSCWRRWSRCWPARDEYFIGCDVSPCVFEMYWRLRGLEKTVMDMAAEPELTDEMFGRCADFAVELSEAACQRFPLDWLWTGDDVASQRSLVMSPATWRRMIKPHLARVFDVGKAHGLWVAYHCCGALRPIIADLVEMGLDVLNPVQCNCPGHGAVGIEAGVRRASFRSWAGSTRKVCFPTARRTRCGGRRGG